jgi:hypothetical protein
MFEDNAPARAAFEHEGRTPTMEPAGRKSRIRRRIFALEGLEDRRLMSASSAPDVVVEAATTLDSRGVTVVYDVAPGAAGKPIQFSIYRSAEPTLGADDLPAGTAQVLPPSAGQGSGRLDLSGHSATAAGQHTVTLALPGGLPPVPSHPYVVVAAANSAGADSSSSAGVTSTTSSPVSTASFRTFTIGVIVHGGKQPKSWARNGPPWERRMAAQLRADGYDAVIPYNWVAASSTPGLATAQGPKLAALVAQAAAQFPATAPVDVHFIGHSEGAVVNSQAILALNTYGWPANLKAGYLKVTMLDPHAANNNITAKQYSVSNGLLGYIARSEINAYQSRAKDPLPVVTSNVQDAEVFYQHTPVRQTFTSNGGIYNLWGQVPVQGEAHYFDLTAKGISHAGSFGVQDWYRLNVVPTLGDGGMTITASAVSGAPTGVLTPSANGNREQVQYAGTAAPGTHVRLWAAPPYESTDVVVGRARAASDGSWQITTKPLASGRYRVIATTTAPRFAGHRRSYYRPTAWLPALTVPSTPSTS